MEQKPGGAQNVMPTETITLGEAEEMLGVKRAKLWRIIRAYKIHVFTDVLDNRYKRVRRDAVAAVLADAERVRRGVAA